jgi:MFS family permease
MRIGKRTTDPLSGGRFRWDVPVAGLCVMLSYAALYAGPVYRAAAATAYGWSQEAAAGAFALGFLVTIPVPFLAGRAADHWGARHMLAAGAVLAAFGLLGAAASRALWQWYATTGVILLMGSTMLRTAASLLAAVDRRRGSALGMILGATGVGLAIGPPLMQLLLDAWGWRVALVIEGVGLILLAVVVVSIVPSPAGSSTRSPVTHQPGATAAGPVRTILLAGFCVGNVCIALYDESVYQHAYAYGRSLGLSRVAATGILSATSTTYIVGGVCGGALSDGLGRRPVLVGAALGSAAALLGLAHSSAETAWLWGGAFGLGLGASSTVRSAVCADIFAGPRLGRDLGLITPGYWVGAVVVTYGGAAWLESGGSFQAFYTAAAAAADLWAVLGTGLIQLSRYPYPPGRPSVEKRALEEPPRIPLSTRTS